jgi:hypothetical protein
MPEPVGRFEFSLNPFKMLAQLVGDDVLVKIYSCLCMGAICTLIVLMFPMIFSNLISALIIDFI